MKKILITSVLLLGVALTAQAGFWDWFQSEPIIEPELQLGLSVMQVVQGGTGAGTFTSGECLVGAGTGAITTAACGGAGTSNWSTTSEAYYWTTQDTADLTEGTNLYYTQARVWDDTWASTTLDTILTNSQTAYGWGDWSGEGFITDLSGFTTANLSENTNLYFTNTRVADYINGSSTMPVGDWNTAFGWGDHSGAGYYASADFATDWDDTYNATTTLNGFTDNSVTWDALVTFPGFTSLSADYSFTDNSTDWDTAYGWGDHSGLYLLDSESDTMTGTLTADGLTLGSTELITIGTNLFTHDATDFTLDDTLAITGYATSTLGINSQGTLHIGGNGIIEGTLGVTGTLTADVTGALTGNADTVTGFTPASGSLTLAGADALTLTTTGETNSTLPLGTKTLVATDVTTLSSLTTVGALGAGSLAAGFTDVVVAQGGTGASTFTDGGVLLGSGTDPFTALGQASNGQLVIGSTGADPVLAALTCGDNITCTIGAGTLEIDVDDSFIKNDVADTGVGISLTYSTTTGTMTIPQGASITPVIAGEIGIDTTSDQFKYFGSALNVLVFWKAWGGNFSSTTLATTGATTTLADKMAIAAQTFVSGTCFTDIGTTTIACGDATNKSYFDCPRLQADTPANNKFTFSSNNTFTADEYQVCEFGNSLGSPTRVSWELKRTITAD